MEQLDISRISDEIAKAMGEKIGAKGRGLKAKLRHSGRQLPGDVRDSIKFVIEAERKMANPKLMKQVDPLEVGRAKHAVLSYLQNADPTEATRKAAANYFSGLALNLLLLAVLIVAILMWRGFL